jgi:LysM repeat protein
MKSPTLVELTPVEYAKEDDENESPVTGYDDYYDPTADKFEGRFSMSGPRIKEPEEHIRRREETKARRRTGAHEQKRAMNLLAGLCAVLFVVSFVMGAGLIRNQDRIDNAEAQIRQLTTALRNHMAIEISNVAPVFAEDDVPLANEIASQELISASETVATPSPAPTETPLPTPTPQAVETAAFPTPQEETALIMPIPETYTIQPGDSLLAISLHFFGDANMVAEILSLNNIENPDLIVAGRTISLPRR